MPLSPDEMKVLATIERDLREEDPALAAALGRPDPSPSPALPFPLGIREVLLLLGALVGLIAAAGVFAEQLGAAGVAALTFATVVPWLVVALRSAERRSQAAGRTDRPSRSDPPEQGSTRRTGPLVAGRGALLTVLPILAALALMPAEWQSGASLLVMFVGLALLPRLVVTLVARSERRAPRRPGE